MSEPSASPNSCPKCGAALPSAATAGLCPRCLMSEAMQPTQPDAEPVASRKVLSPAELAPHFPQLEILECLGRGGMGVVYQVRQKSLNRFAALKLLAPERVADAQFAQRFTQEAQALAALNHPSIVTIYDFGQAGGFYFLLMEFVDGVNLRQAMKAGRFTPEQALAVVPPVCEALQYAHEHGIVHRDIKPENLLLDKEGRVKIADFGIAKMLGAPASGPAARSAEHCSAGEPANTSAEQCSALQTDPTHASVAGTPQYMAPEQKAHRVTDHRADIYSLGVVLYELLTGELPADKLQPPSRKVQIDVRLDEIVLRALEHTPELRFQTAGEFRTQVETFEREDREKRIEDGEEKIGKNKQPPALSSIRSPLSSPPPPLLKTANAYLSTPEWLASARGKFWAYTGKGTLVLTRDQLAFTDEKTGATTSIPLAAIRDVSLGNYPWLAKPAPLHYLSVTWVENGLTRCRYFTPNRGWFMPVWETNPVVIEWHQALRAAVTTATGKAPAETPAPPHRPTAGELVGVGLTFGLPLCLIAAAFIHLRQVADNPEPWWQSGWFLASIAIGFVPLLLVWFLTRRPSQANGQPGGEPAKRVTPAVLLMLLLLNGMIISMVLIAARLLTDFFANPALAGRSNIDPAFITKLANLLAEHPGIAVFAAIVVSVVVDFLIIGSGWGAASRPAADSGVSIPPAPSAAAAVEPQTMAAEAPPFPSASASEYVSSWGFRITPGPAIKTGYVRFWESLFGSVNSPGAINALNLSRIGFIGILAPLAILPGWRWCWPAFGFLGMFGMISAAYLSEATARSGVDLSKTDGAEDAKARRADWRKRIVWLIVGGGILPMTFFALALFVALGRGGEKAMEAATIEQMVTVFAKVLGVGLGLALMIWALLRVVWPKPANAANPWPRHPEALVALSLLWPLLLITAPFAIGQFVGTSAERLHWETLRADPSRSALMNSTEWVLWGLVLVLVVGGAMEITRNLRRTMRAMDDPSASPEPEPPTQSRWQGWDVWTIGLLGFLGFVPGLEFMAVCSVVFVFMAFARLTEWWFRRRQLDGSLPVRKWWHKVLINVLLAIAIAIPLQAWVLQAFVIPVKSMEPELPAGSRVLVWKLTRQFAPGDIIAHKHGERVWLSRVVRAEKEQLVLHRNQWPEEKLPRADVIGKVISVLWRASASSGVTQFDIVPVGVSNNVVIVDVTTEVGRGNAELRAVLDGPESHATNMVPLFAGTLVKPAQNAVNHPFRILWPGRQRWRLAFVLPNAALAKEAFEDIRPIGALPAVGDRTMAGTVFEVRDANGQEFHATLQVALPFTSNDPNRVSVFGHCQNTESVVTLTWQVLASGSGLAHFSRVGSPILALRHNPQTMLHGVTVRLELIQAGANRVQFVRHIGGDPIREELVGNFRELADELLRTATFGAKATSGTRIELCQFQGKPFTVQVDVPVSTVTTSKTATSPAISRVEISRDRAVAHSANYDGSGLLITFGTGTNRWTPSGLFLDGLFNVTLEWPSTKSGARHVIQPRHGIHMNYRLDGPPGPMLGKLVFHPGTARPDAEGLCVIGEFRPDTGEPLPLAVQFVADQATQPRAASPSSITTLAPVKMVSWSFPILGIGVIGLCVIGGIVLLVWLVRKGGTAGKVVAVLCIVPMLLLAVVLVGYLSMRTGSATEELQTAKDAAAREQGLARASVTLFLLGTDGKQMPRTTLALVEVGGRVSKTKTQDRVASGLTDDMGFVHALGAPPDRPWEIVVLRDGEEIMRSAPISTPVAANSRTGAPNYFLELRATAEAKLDALLTPLSLEANLAVSDAPLDGVLAARLAIATKLQELTAIPENSDEKGAIFVPPFAFAPVPKRVEIAGQIELLLRQTRTGGEDETDVPSGAARPSSAQVRKSEAPAPPGALFSAEKPVVLPGDATVRVRLVLAAKDGNKQRLDEEIIFKTATDRATGFVLRWHAYGDKHPQQANEVLVHLVDPDTGVILHRMEGGFGSGLNLTSPDHLPLPAKNKSHLLAGPGTYTSFHLIRVEQPAAPGVPITAWWDIHAEVTHISPAAERPVPAFQMPTLAPKPAPPAKAAPAVAPLVRREVKEKTPDGRDVAMTFAELRRDAKTSVATVKSVGGGSVGSAMFITRGAYDIAKARGAAHFINLKEWESEDGAWMILIGFAPDKNVDPKTYFDLKEPLPADKRLLFLSVAAYERIFKDQP